MLNVIIATGRLVDAPEVIKTKAEKQLVKFTIAIDNTRKEVDGTRGTCFLDCILFTEKVDIYTANLDKGSKVAVKGGLNQRNFERKDGSKGRAYEIAVDSLEFLDAKKQEEEDDLPFDKSPEVESPKFDPYTGKPLKQNKK